MQKVFGRAVMAMSAVAALASIQSTAAVAQTRSECQKYSVTTCAGDRWQGLGYGSYTECQQAEYFQCINGGPIDAALQFKPEPLLMPSQSAART